MTSTLSVCNRGQCASSSFQLSDPKGGTWEDHTGITELQFSPDGRTLYFQVLAPPDPNEVVHMFTMPNGPDMKVVAAEGFTIILKGLYTGFLAAKIADKIVVIDPRTYQKTAEASIADYKNWQKLVELRRQAAEP